MSDECIELKNIKYQTMLLSSKNKISSNDENISDFQKFLDTKQTINESLPWSKLEKTVKIKKIKEYLKKKDISKEQLVDLEKYILKCLKRKKLNRTKDVKYDISSCSIQDIPGITFNKSTKKYTLTRDSKKKKQIVTKPRKTKKRKN